MIVKRQQNIIELVTRPGYGSHLPDSFRDFVKKCLIRDERERWSASELLEHPWIKDSINFLQGRNLSTLSGVQQQGTSRTSPPSRIASTEHQPSPEKDCDDEMVGEAHQRQMLASRCGHLLILFSLLFLPAALVRFFFFISSIIVRDIIEF